MTDTNTTPDHTADWIIVTDAERAALIERAEYLGWIGRKSVDSMIPVLRTEPRINPWLVQQLGEISPDLARVYLKPAHPAGGCGGRGYYWVYDTDYPCGGCYQCKPAAQPAAHIGCFIYNAGTFVERFALARCVTAMECLAKIGAAVEAALGIGREIAKGFQAFVADWNVPVKGAWYRVTATRGRAVADRGAEGECVWLDEVPAARYGHRTTTRLGLRISGRQGLVYVNSPSVERIPLPATAAAAKAAEEAAKAAIEAKKQAEAEIASVLPVFQGKTGRNGDLGCVISGKYKGRTGRVFWVGVTRKGDHTAGMETATGEKLWVGAREVVAPIGRAHVEHDIAERLFMLLADAGFEAEAAAYGALAVKLEGRVQLPPVAAPVKAKRVRKSRAKAMVA